MINILFNILNIPWNFFWNHNKYLIGILQCFDSVVEAASRMLVAKK